MEVSKLLKISFFFLLMGILITSCSKEDIEPITPEVDQMLVDDIKNRNDLGVFDTHLFDDCDCFGPFDAIDWESDDIEVIEAQIEAALASLSDEELEALFTPVCTEDGAFYPNACFAECEGVTDYEVCEDGDFGCDIDDFDIIDCYQIVFPITVNFGDGSTIVVNNDDELLDALFTHDQEPQFVYPFDVTNEDGDVITITNDEDWANLGVICFDQHGGPGGGNPQFDCYEIVYPAELLLGTNAAVTVSNVEEEFEAIISYLESLGADEIPMISYVYPLDINFVDEDIIISVSSEMEMFELIIEHCD